MARPRHSPDQKLVPLHIRVTPVIADRLSHLSLKHDKSIYAIAGTIVERVVAQWGDGPSSGFAHQKTSRRKEACYASSSPRSSTLSGLLPF